LNDPPGPGRRFCAGKPTVAVGFPTEKRVDLLITAIGRS
jgi:hypothetical protein